MVRVWTAAVADVYISVALFLALSQKKTGFKGRVRPYFGFLCLSISPTPQIRQNDQQAREVHSQSWCPHGVSNLYLDPLRAVECVAHCFSAHSALQIALSGTVRLRVTDVSEAIN